MYGQGYSCLRVLSVSGRARVLDDASGGACNCMFIVLPAARELARPARAAPSRANSQTPHKSCATVWLQGTLLYGWSWGVARLTHRALVRALLIQLGHDVTIVRSSVLSLPRYVLLHRTMSTYQPRFARAEVMAPGHGSHGSQCERQRETRHGTATGQHRPTAAACTQL
jgi:hypothetical protein